MNVCANNNRAAINRLQPPPLPEWPDRDPNEVSDFILNWAPRLRGDPIASSEWFVVSGGISLPDNTFTASTTVLWISGGSPGGVSVVTNRVTTEGGRTFDQSVRIKTREQ